MGRRKLKVLFVCTGNTCRSPMAKIILEDMFQRSEMRHKIQVDSAGLMACRDIPASELAVEVFREHGLDLSWHRSKPVTDELILEADLIVVMQASHKKSIEHCGLIRGQEIRLLSEFCPGKNEPQDIIDPYGGDKKMYEEAFEKIISCVQGLFVYLTQENKKR